MVLFMHMVQRNYWKNAIEALWKKKSIIWLSGVRRAGKTFLSKSLENAEYFDCELPRTRKMMEDPEEFLNLIKGKRIILDEIHRLKNPSELLKIAADHYPESFILATGSSTLGVSAKFKDTLTGRKRQLWLTPMCLNDLDDFNAANLEHRFLHGGLPPFFLSSDLPEQDFQEWIDAYWAKDIQELFRIERRYSFQRFFELLMIQSSGIFEATKFSKRCEISRTSITNYLKVLESTFVVHVIRPFSTYRPTEIVSAPKVYGFDTGFISYLRGITKFRDEDFGLFWEHFVLNEIHAKLQTRDIKYWRDKRGHEIDFILQKRGETPVAIECKWKSPGGDFEDRNIKAFLKQYPASKVYIVSSDVTRTYHRKIRDHQITITNIPALIKQFQTKS
ncbi:MAG: ATP-binding protein [Candidatus Omnitrophota bacterium]|nr:ATP-binding protein [Candidatus Omnitrophota bacterium]